MKGLKLLMQNYSVLMSLYNKENPRYLKEAIDSILNQTIPPSEFIIIKDGKLTKELEDTLKYYIFKFPHLFYIYGYNENKGLGYALNFGMQYCNNELIARMDADDIAHPKRCELQLKEFQTNPQLSIIGSFIQEFYVIEDKKNLAGKRIVPLEDKEIKKYIKKRCPFNHMTVMLKKSDVIKSGGYKKWHFNEDYYLWIRMLENNCIFKNIPKVLVLARIDKNMYQRRGGIKYFISEKKLQQYMLKRHIITYSQYYINILLRLLVQVILPSFFREKIYNIFARRNR